MGQFSLKRLFVAVTILAVAAGIFSACIHDQLPHGSRRLALPLVFGLFMGGFCLPLAKTKTELLVAILIGAGLGALMY